eukprot:m.44421 g.44421  ORF g.44421 m.44421 type:complete len:282 (+) comp13011_c0_seq1:288-1133(+)
MPRTKPTWFRGLFKKYKSLEEKEKENETADGKVERRSVRQSHRRDVQKLITNAPDGKPAHPKRRLRMRWRKKTRESSSDEAPAMLQEDSLAEWVRKLHYETLQPRDAGALMRFRSPLELSQALEAEEEVERLPVNPSPPPRPVLVPSRMCPDNLRFFSVQPFSLREKIRRWARVTNFQDPETPPEHLKQRERLDSVVPLPVPGKARAGTRTRLPDDSPTLDRSVSQRPVNRPKAATLQRYLERPSAPVPTEQRQHEDVMSQQQTEEERMAALLHPSRKTNV